MCLMPKWNQNLYQTLTLTLTLRTWQSRPCAPMGRGKADCAPLTLGDVAKPIACAPLTLGDVAKPAWAPTRMQNRECRNNSPVKVHPAAGTIATSFALTHEIGRLRLFHQHHDVVERTAFRTPREHFYHLGTSLLGNWAGNPVVTITILTINQSRALRYKIQAPVSYNVALLLGQLCFSTRVHKISGWKLARIAKTTV